MSRFDRNLLGALDALLGERNVTRAAERLGVTQPTMSGKLQRLRYQFDDELLVRNGRDMDLTPFATSLVGPVRQAIDDIESLFLRGEPSFNAASSARAFRIMVSDDCLSMLMPRVVARVASSAPGIQLQLEVVRDPVEKLLSGEADICLASNDLPSFSQMTAEEKIQSELLYSDEFVCVVDDKHPLGEGATIEEYLGFSHVGVGTRDHAGCVIAEAIRHHSSDFQFNVHVPDFSLVPEMVARTNLVGMIPKRLAKTLATSLPVRTFFPPFAIPTMNTCMLWRTRGRQDLAHSWLRDMLRSECALWCADVSTIATIARKVSSADQSHVRSLNSERMKVVEIGRHKSRTAVQGFG